MTATYDEVLISLGMEPSGDAEPVTGCGSHSGYVSHLYHGERPCAPCRKANADYKRARRAAPKDPATMPPIKHGTHTGARQHRYRGEEPCQDCREAYRAWNSPRKRGWRTGRKQVAA